MRRLYVCPHIAVHTNSDLFGGTGAQYVDLIPYANPTDNRLKRHWDHDHPDNAAWRALPEVAAWIADGGLVLTQATVDHNEYSETQWHANPDVAILPHPTFEGAAALSTFTIVRAASRGGDGQVLSGSPTKKIEQRHIDALAVLGITADDTVWQVSDKAAALVPGVKLRAIL